MSLSALENNLPNDPSHIMSSVKHVKSRLSDDHSVPVSHSYRIQQRRNLTKVTTSSTLNTAFQNASCIVEFKIDSHQWALDKIEQSVARFVLSNPTSTDYNLLGAFSLLNYYEIMTGGNNIMTVYNDNLIDIVYQTSNDMELNNLSGPLGFETQYFTEGITIKAGSTAVFYVPIFSLLQQFDMVGALNTDITFRFHLKQGSDIYQPQGVYSATGGAGSTGGYVFTAVAPLASGLYPIVLSTAELYNYGYKTYQKSYDDLYAKVVGKTVSYKFLTTRWTTNSLANFVANSKGSMQLSILSGKFSSFTYRLLPASINSNVSCVITTAAAEGVNLTKYGNQYAYTNNYTSGYAPTYRIPLVAQGCGLVTSYITDSSGTPILNIQDIPSDYLQYWLSGYIDDSTPNSKLYIYNISFGDYRLDTRTQIYNELISLNGLSNLYFTAVSNLPSIYGQNNGWQVIVTGLQASTVTLNPDGSLRLSFH